MYENKVITEPIWKTWVIKTTDPLLTAEQCKIVMDTGRSLKPEKALIGMGNEK